MPKTGRHLVGAVTITLDLADTPECRGLQMTQPNDLERRILASACVGTDISPELIEELLELERDNERRLRRRGLSAALRGSIEDFMRDRSSDSH